MEEIKCNQVGMRSGGKWDKLHDQSRRVYGIDGLAPTMHTCSGGNLEPKILVPEATKKGYDTATYGDSINMAYPNSKTRRGRVGHGVAQTITTGDSQQVIIEPLALDEQNGYIRQDGCVGTLTTDGSSPKHNNRIIEPRIAAMRGRNPDNPSDRTAGSPTEPRLEIGNEETSNTLTTVQKDNLVVEPHIIYERPLDRKGWHHKACEVLNVNGITTCLHCQSNNLLQKIKEEPSYRIRKLTEKECFRLMGVKQEDCERVAKNQSTSSLYHLAGDALVTTVLMAILGELFSVKDYKDKINNLVDELKENCHE